MGYHTKCQRCYGDGKTWQGEPCDKCGASGQVKPYRRALTKRQSSEIGWDDLSSVVEFRDKKCCLSCNKPLPGRKTSYCCGSCQSGYICRVWKAAHWQKRAIANRDGAACRGCGTVHESPIRPGGKPYPDFSQLQLDHVRALHLGGDESPTNCQLLCEACHRSKTTRERRRSSARSPTPTTGIKQAAELAGGAE